MFKGLICALIVMVWTGVAHATLSVTPPPNFGDVGVSAGPTAIAASIASSEAGGEDLAQIQLGSGCGPFTVTPAEVLPRTISTLDPLAISITFDPSARGAATCTVALLDGAGDELGTFQISGNGIAPVISAPASTSFGTVRVSTGTQTRNVVVQNTGDDTLTVGTLAIVGADYTIDAPATPFAIAAGSSANVSITFDPSATGTRDAMLAITSNDPATPMTIAGLTGTGGAAIIAVTDVNFGDVTDNTTATQSITISNTGSPVSPLTVTSATITGSSWFKFDTGSCAGQSTCTFAGLTVGALPQTVGVRCTPVSTDAVTMQVATVQFTSDSDAGGDDTALLTCVAGRPNITVTPSLAFGDVVVGQTGGPLTVTVQNTGNRALTYNATKLGGARYTLGGSCHTSCTVAAGASQTFTVAFAPLAVGQQDFTIAVASNDPDTPTANVAVTGRGVAPSIQGPANMQLGNVELGKTNTLPLTITNNGTSNLTITSAVVQAGATDYAATGNAGTQVVAPGATATWNVTCSPQAQGSRPGNFRIVSDALGAGQLDIPLACTGTRGLFELDPTSLTFGNVPQDTTATLTVTLKNTGNLPVTGITAVSTNAAYAVVAGTLPSALAANTSATVSIRFAPTAAATGGNATITFQGSWGTTPTATIAVLAVSGTGTTNGYTVSTTAIDFGDFRYDQQPTRTFCITNTGQSPVTIGSPIAFVPTGGTASNEFAVTTIKKQATCGTAGSTVTLPQTLATSEVLEVTVRAQPANRTGPLTGNLTITSNLPANPNRTVALAANAISAMLTVNPGTTVSFGDVDVQGAPVTATVKLRNTGAAPLDLGSFARTANAAFTFTLPSDTTLAPNTEISFVVTYAPTVALATDETVTITHATAGDFNAPALGMIVLRGRGIDRDLEILGGTPLFPDTFRNPGSAGPVRAVSIHNRGTAPLTVSSIASTDPEVWKVLDPDAIVIPPNATMDIRVRFEPTGPGRADARLQIVNDDVDGPPPITPKTTEVPLTGTCVDRRVSFNPNTINVGYVEIGQTYTIPEALIVRSMDDANTFTIKRIDIDGGAGAFAIPGAENITLDRVAMERRFDVTFTPTEAGPIVAKAQLFLDEDPVHQSEIELQGTAVFVDARGGGGCATGHGMGAGAIALVLLVVLRRRRAALAMVAMLAVVPAARADDDNILLSVFEPTPQTSGESIQLQSPVIGAHGAWVLSAVYSYASKPLLHLASSGTEHGVITSSSLIELGAAVAVLGKLELGASMPFYSQTGEALGNRDTEYTAPPADGTATGDLRVHGKIGFVRTPLAGNGQFALAGSIALTLPTATDGMLTGVDHPSARVLALASLVPGAFDTRVTLTANLGAAVRAPAAYKNLEQKSGVIWGLGASVRVADPLWLSGEVFGEFVPSGRETMDGSSTTLSPIEWLGGLRWQPDHRFAVSLAGGRGLTSAAGAPALRGVFALTFTPMAAPSLRGPRSSKLDVDTDHDGIVDHLDKCPDEPEDLDLFEDSDGCPDLDNDHDGVPDEQDKCPLEPEDKDGFEDDDGCVDNDNDRDGIPDAMDKCPDEPEDKDGFQDGDGCPDLDNDGDGIPDAQDKCPNEPETINGNQDNDGCPDQGFALVIIALDRLDLMESIQFTKEKLKPVSYNLLGQIGATLRAHPEILRVRIGVHVAASNDEDKDQQLSDKRAQAIREWLVQWGIAAKRLDVRGFGSSKPIGASAAANERVEIVIMEKK